MTSKTQFRGSGSSGLARDGRCPACQRPCPGPFCLQDGQLVQRPFTIAERYVVHELLGAGASAFVFGARDNVLGRQVALKILRPTLDPVEAHRFLRAARLASQLRHENIVVIHDCGEDAALGLVFLVMERLNGQPLADVLAQTKQLPWRRAIAIVVQLCRALAESHERGVLHRDLSPRNITLTTTSGRCDVVKLCDFGLARSSAGQDRITTTGTAVGTPAYMAPEQILGDDGQDQRIDLYALGVIAYELLSGALPFDAATPVAMITAKLAGPALPLSERGAKLELPTGLEELVMSCLEREPSARPESAAAIERALLALGDTGPVPRAPGADLVGERIGHYRVIERLNQGGMGEVYVVEHDVIGSRAALKVLRAELVASSETTDRLIQEARASSEIASPHVARSFDFGFLPDQRPYVLMELVDGEPADAQLALRGPLPLAEVQQIIAQACHALAAAHDIGIIHRDIKPANLMLTRRPEGLHVRVLDFGIAKVFTAPANQTQIGAFMGTPIYCAPEQVLGEPVSPASDIYALGATAYELLTGQPPFSGETGYVLAIKTQRDPTSIRELRPALPDAVAQTVAAMMARDKAKRPRSMRAVAAEVAGWPTAAALDAKPVRATSSRRLVWILGALAVLVGVAIALWPHDEPSRGRADSTPTAPSRVIRATEPADPAATQSVTSAKTPPSQPVSASTAPTPTPSQAPSSATRANASSQASRPREDQPPATAAHEAAAPKQPAQPTRRRPAQTGSATTPSSTRGDVLIVDPFQ